MRPMFTITPISASSKIRLVPPEEKKGRLMPVLGRVLVTCHAICAMMPMPTMVQYRFSAL